MRYLLVAALLLLCLGTVAQADQFWGSASMPWGTGGPVLFALDTSTGTVGTTYAYPNWSWIMAATCAPGRILYAVYNPIGDLYNFRLAKVDATTGAVLSDTLVKNLTFTDYPQWNALEFHDGKLYAVENCTFGSAYSAGLKRGYIYEVGLDAYGDPISATLGAYIGGYPAPDGALAYRDGTWYASDWKTDHSSWIKKTTDIMATDFTATVGTSPVGLFDGWDFEADGRSAGRQLDGQWCLSLFGGL